MRGLAQFFRRRRLEGELAAEIEAHIEERAEELVESGMNPAAALRAARVQFGNRTAVLERSREVWTFPLESLLHDMRIGARSLWHAPLFTAAVVATLALGIGANAAIFSLIDAVLLRPLPFPESQRIVMLWERPPKRVVTASLGTRRRQNPVSPMNFLDWRDRLRSFEAMAAISPPNPVGLGGFGDPIAVDGLSVSADFFRILAVQPLLGRTLNAEDEVPGAPPVTVLSYHLWRQQFGGDRAVVGRTVRILGAPATIVGVMPEGFDLAFAHADLWGPFRISRAQADEGRYLNVIARLKPGVSMARAQTDLESVARQLAAERPESNRDWGAGIVSLYEQTTGEVGRALWLLFGAVALVLLIAAGNVAGLLLMRCAERQREIALRSALGASRDRIASQVLAESLVLSLAGGLLGVGLAVIALHAITASLPALALPRLEGAQVDARMLAFGFALSLGTTLLFGLGPALALARTGPGGALKTGDARITLRGGRFRKMLVVAEVALSVVLLAGAGLLARSFLNQVGVSRGFRIDHVLTMRMFFAPGRYYDDHRRGRYLDEMVSRVRALPGVEAASSVNLLPMTGIVSGSGFRRLDRSEPAPGSQPTADFVVVSPQYFAAMGIPLLGGRDFDQRDTISAEPAIVVNQAFADKFFPAEDPLGKRLGLDWNVQHGVIVGLAANARQTSLAIPAQPTIFLAQIQGPMYFGALVVRTRTAPAALAHAVVEAVHAADPDQAISDIESMEQVVEQSVARPRLEAFLLGVFAVMALLLASIGLYGLLAYSVARRTREIGIRMALGANTSRLVGDVVREGLRLILAGMLAGLVAALALTRLLASLLYEVKTTDPPTSFGVCGLLLAVGLCAAWVPARRIVTVDPARSLRWE
jgi:putative ABC transport system permease protein